MCRIKGIFATKVRVFLQLKCIDLDSNDKENPVHAISGGVYESYTADVFIELYSAF